MPQRLRGPPPAHCERTPRQWPGERYPPGHRNNRSAWDRVPSASRWRRSTEPTWPRHGPCDIERRACRASSAHRRISDRHPKTVAAELPVAAAPASELDVFPRDLACVVYAQAELRRKLDMPRLADELDRSEFLLVGCALPDRDRALAFALVFDDGQQLPVDRYRIGAEQHLF